MTETASADAVQPQAAKERPAHWFKPGQSGNPAGRLPGSRQKLTNAFVQDLQESWELHGKEALRRCAVEEPAVYVRTVAMLMPKDVNLSIDVESFVVRAPMVAASSEAWQTMASAGGEVIDHVSPVLPNSLETEQTE